MSIYRVYNGPMPTTAALTKVTTGTSIKTMIQLVGPATSPELRINAWGISFDGSSAATPIECELIETGTVAATVTAYVANDVFKIDGPNDGASGIQLGSSLSGYTSTSEGSITASKIYDTTLVPPTGPYVYQYVFAQQPKLKAGNVLRVRVTAGTAVNAVCWIEWIE